RASFNRSERPRKNKAQLRWDFMTAGLDIDALACPNCPAACSLLSPWSSPPPFDAFSTILASGPTHPIFVRPAPSPCQHELQVTTGLSCCLPSTRWPQHLLAGIVRGGVVSARRARSPERADRGNETTVSIVPSRETA